MRRDENVTEIKAELAKINPAVKNEWLGRIYDSRVQRFVHDNDRIWSTGALLVPLSLAPFLALPGAKRLTDAEFVFLGLASTVLMLLWLLIAERHRQLQDRSLQWVDAIEEDLGMKRVARRGPHFASWGRRLLTICIPLLWVFAALWWPRTH
jgi:hypothetical protein